MKEWPHAPPHMLSKTAVYMVTASTYHKQHFFKSEHNIQFLHDKLLQLASNYEWQLHAWAVFSNHYHFIAQSPENANTLVKFISHLHQETAIAVNEIDGQKERKVWYNFWETRLTYHPSYLARLNYVHQNPVLHGLVGLAANYPWCSANKFESMASHSFVKSVYSFDYNKVKIYDKF